tara:strand:+ start:3699 stop:4538 length:840 start_codon:yes stop_codon:yes gene_type:complete
MNIGLLGRNSTHFLAYGKVFAELGNNCFYTDEENSIEKDLNNYKNFKRTTPLDLAENCQLILITSRFADEHLPTLNMLLNIFKCKSKIFVDKPIVNSIKEVKEIINLEKNFSNSITSFSPLRFCNEILFIKELISENINSFIDLEICAPISAEDIGDDKRFKSPLFYGVHAVEMGLEISNYIFDEKVDISNKVIKDSKIIDFRNYNKSIKIILKPSLEEIYNIKLRINKKTIFDNDVNLDGTYYSNCAYKLLKFGEKGFLDSNLPTLKEACKGINLLIG